ncbi:MAG: capsule biosynthesis protein, partial [Paracoccaceae bacterium]
DWTLAEGDLFRRALSGARTKEERSAIKRGLVARLRERGVDIAARRSPLLEIANDPVDRAAAENEVGPGGGRGREILLSDAEREAEIARIQRDLVRRRRKRLALLFAKLAFFVLLPTFFAGYYFYNIATEMYETKAEFVIQKSEVSGQSTFGGLLSGTGFANSADSITVQGYLTSREAMIRLDKDLGFAEHFKQERIDKLQRLPEDASTEDTYALYKRNVTVGYDPTEGVIKLSVVAATPEASQKFAKALIAFAEERVDNLSQRVRADQMKGARANYDEAETAMLAAQQRVVELQQSRGVLSAEVEMSAQMSIINSLELELEQKRLALAEIMANRRPNDTKASVIRAEIKRIEARVGELRAKLTSDDSSQTSLAGIAGELRVAEAELATRQLLLQQAVQQLQTAQSEANRQVRYLSMGVEPVAPDQAAYPRKFENTLLAFVIFLGIYILLSLTVSILREQISV